MNRTAHDRRIDRQGDTEKYGNLFSIQTGGDTGGTCLLRPGRIHKKGM
jgi:hypothetical protein